MQLREVLEKFLDDESLYLTCSTHGAIYDPESGRCAGGPCTGKGLEPVPVSERDGAVWFDPQSLHR